MKRIKKLEDAKAFAKNQILAKAKFYRENGFVDWLVQAYIDEKIKMIESAETISELKEIVSFEFIPSPYHSEAEELFQWSLASLRAPLNACEIARYMALMEKFFHFKP